MITCDADKPCSSKVNSSCYNRKNIDFWSISYNRKNLDSWSDERVDEKHYFLKIGNVNFIRTKKISCP